MEEISVNGTTYDVVGLLGKGKGGYSYLAERGGRRFVVKQIHHEPCEYYTFGNKIEAERRDYERLSKIGIRMPRLLAVDVGNERILKEYVEGETAFDLVLRGGMLDEYISQVREMCALLYPQNTNIDYFPTNFVVHDSLVYYIDFECNDYMDEWNFENWGIKYWSKTQEFLECAEKMGRK